MSTTLTEAHTARPAQSRGARVLHMLGKLARRCEPAIAATLALYAGWLAVQMHPRMPVLWALAGSVALITWWLLRNPVRSQEDVLVRACTVVAAGVALQLWVGRQGGPASGLYVFHWIVVSCLNYAVLFHRFGVAADRLAARDRSSHDATTGLLSLRGLMVDSERVLRDCESRSRPVTLLAVECPDLLKLRKIYGNSTGRRILAQMADKLRTVAGREGLSARVGPTSFAVVLPGVTPDTARQSLGRVLGQPARIEYDAGGDEIVLVPDVGAVNVPAGDSLDQVLRKLLGDLGEQRAWQRQRERHLSWEHSRHSAPVPLASMVSQPASSVAPRDLPQWPGEWSDSTPQGGRTYIPTMPAPLQRVA